MSNEESENSLPLEVYKTLKHAHHHLKKDLRKKIKESGFTWTQFHALYHVEEEGIAVNELAAELHCNASNITGLIDRMKEHDLVYREHSQKDRRVWLVKLNPAGRKLKNELFPRHLNNIKERMSMLNEEELKTLKKLLQKLIEGE